MDIRIVFKGNLRKVIIVGLNQNIIFDGRNLYDVEDIKKEGISYLSIGR